MKKEKIRAVRGVQDVLPPQSSVWQRMEAVARDAFHRYGFGEIKIPVFEKTDLFARGIGEATDIVHKEMYTFEDRGGDSLTLRPEATASIVRAYLEHHLDRTGDVTRLYCIGPMFRYERPQAGRLRQFHQIDCEVFGSSHPAVDAEIIALAWEILSGLGLRGMTAHLNTLGGPADRPGYLKALRGYFRDRLAELCEDCNRRFRENPLRILDCKNEGCRRVTAQAPALLDHLGPPSRENFELVQRLLQEAGVPYELNPRLVRGLDYYTHTAFEITAEGLGAQNAVAGGGRYDGLVELLGGAPTPATGFAIGMERLASLVPKVQQTRDPDKVFLVALGERAAARAFGWAQAWRKAGLAVLWDCEGRSLKSQMKKADRSGAAFAILIGEDELGAGAAQVRDLRDGSQRAVPFDQVPEEIRRGAG
ncbi:MAG: histidine--tRNA ligase [Candidatus Tectomicrobia bacterium]|nr:histidine--tRNA ligase [Candidatus Tectomicrobia bacterium]